MACDPDFSDVVLLTTFQGTAGDTSFTDLSSYARTLSQTGGGPDATLVSTPLLWGTTSLRLIDGGKRVVAAPAAATDLSTPRQWTWEMWLNAPNGATAFTMWMNRNFTALYPLKIQIQAGVGVAVEGADATGVVVYTATGSGFSINTWHHVAVVRDNNTFYLFVDGVAVSMSYPGGGGGYSGDLGTLGNAGDSYLGLTTGADMFVAGERWTVGVARYTANFTPSTTIWGGECPPDATVPDVVGESLADATTDIEAVNLMVGTVTYANSGLVPVGDVISQSPVGGSTLPEGSPVDLVVSLGPADVTVPDVVGETLSDATTDLTTAGLVVGAVVGVPDPSPVDTVLSQDPIGGATAPSDSPVDLVVSLGPVITVPDVVGLTQTDATAAITSIGLTVGTIGTAYSDTLPINSVVSQDPVSGSYLDSGDPVDIVLSLGPSPVTVPNVVNSSLADAAAILGSVALVVGALSNAFSEDVPAGHVVSQSPFAGSTVLPGAAVALVISNGPEAVSVPDVVGLTSSAAADVLRAVGLRVGRISVDTSGATPLGLISAEFPNAGALVPSGTRVALVLSAIAPPFEVGATVISQYAQSPTLVELIENMADYIDPRTNLTEFYAYVWNVDTATGFGLDVWGKIVGVSRLLRIVADDPIFGFDNASTPPPDWQPWSQGRFARNTGEGGEAVILPDDAYRILILTKALANIASTSSAAINQLLRNLFPGRGKAYVEDLGGMEMRFVFDFALTPVEYAIVSQSGALPHPAGVALSVSVPP